jgi:hypothetical protein
MAARDPEIARRTWQAPMDEMTRTKTGPLETHSARFLKVLEAGSVATNVFLRRLHNFALDMNWLPWPVLPKKQWPQVRFKEKCARGSTGRDVLVFEVNASLLQSVKRRAKPAISLEGHHPLLCRAKVPDRSGYG